MINHYYRDNAIDATEEIEAATQKTLKQLDIDQLADQATIEIDSRFEGIHHSHSTIMYGHRVQPLTSPSGAPPPAVAGEQGGAGQVPSKSSINDPMDLVASACEKKRRAVERAWLGACGRLDLNPKTAIYDPRVLQR